FEDKATYDRWISEIPLRRHAEPREMAGTVLYLVSDAASYTNGECIVVDGGMTV
ncbi:SDR family oxidoreductase, partial [Stenotrophomonas maltophilia]